MAQAVASARLGRVRRSTMLTCAAALLSISPGTVNGLTRRGPRVRRISYCSSRTCTPPMPEPMSTPTRRGIMLGHVEPGIGQSFPGGRDGKVEEAIHAACILLSI